MTIGFNENESIVPEEIKENALVEAPIEVNVDIPVAAPVEVMVETIEALPEVNVGTIEAPQEAQSPVPVKTKKRASQEVKEVVVDNTNLMVECEMVPITAHGSVSDDDSPKKAGRYGHAIYIAEGIGINRWAALAYLKADFDNHRKLGLANKDILERCINFLNIIPEGKKTGKYGRLSLVKEEMQFINKFGYECAVLIFTTDQRKCDQIWGEGK